MELIILTLGMLASFLLGAYVRAPFPLWKRKGQSLPERAQAIRLDPTSLSAQREAIEKREEEARMQEIINMWNYNGTPQKGVQVKDHDE